MYWDMHTISTLEIVLTEPKHLISEKMLLELLAVDKP